jgi:protocatechuate 3,4-dioxygenase beta subunit
MRLRVLILCVCIAGSAVAAGGQSNDAVAPADDASASLSGHVVRDPGGEPIKKALVELLGDSADQSNNYAATTDEEGAFAITGIRPANYHLMVERTGFLFVDAKHHRQSVVTLAIDRSQALKDQMFHMLPCAVVMGRVVDEDGDPMPDALVSVQRWGAPAGASNVNVSERTNDLGQYRIGGLMPGRYLLSVSPVFDVATILDHRTERQPQLSYVPMFYPNTADRGQAAPISLRAGDELPIDFSLVRMPTANLRGSVSISHTGHTVVVLHSDKGSAYNEVEVRPDGSFEIRNVAPGTYDLMAVESTGYKMRTARTHEVVSASNIEGIRMIPQSGAVVRGYVHAPGVPDFSRISINLLAAGEDKWLGYLSAPETIHPARDGSFEWKDVPPGEYYVSTSVEDASEKYVMDSVNAGDREFRDGTISINGGTVLISISVRAKGATLEGDVVDDKGQPIPNAVLVAMPEEAMRSREDRYGTATADQHGHFEIRRLFPGSYAMLAFEALDEGAYLDPTFRKTYLDQATKLSLDPASTKHIQLKVLPAPDDVPAE